MRCLVCGTVVREDLFSVHSHTHSRIEWEAVLVVFDEMLRWALKPEATNE